MEKEYEVIELDSGAKFAMIDAIGYQGRAFLLLGKLNEAEDNISDELSVYEKIDNDIVVIEDNDLLEKLMATFEKRLNQ